MKYIIAGGFAVAILVFVVEKLAEGALLASGEIVRYGVCIVIGLSISRALRVDGRGSQEDPPQQQTPRGTFFVLTHFGKRCLSMAADMTNYCNVDGKPFYFFRYDG